MKTTFPRRATRGMTLFEVLLVLAVITIVVAMILPAKSGGRPSLGTCMNNVRQIDLISIMYASDNHGRFAIQTPIANGGTLEFLDRNQTFPHYQKFSQYQLNTRFFVCPADKDRHPSDNYQNLSDNNLSYFLNADVSTNNPTASILTGDRNLAANGHPVPRGTFILRTNMNLTWTPELHRVMGVLGFADGHAEICRTTNLNSVIQRQGLAAARLSVP